MNALVSGAGGNSSASFTAGFAEVAEDNGIVFDIGLGNSAGGQSCLAISVGGSALLQEFLYQSKDDDDTFKRQSLLRLAGLLGGARGLAKFDPLRKRAIKTFVGKHMAFPVIIQALDLTQDGHPPVAREFSGIVTEDTVDWMLAGMSVRGLIPPYQYRYVDAGAHNIFPDGPLISRLPAIKNLWLVNGGHAKPRGLSLNELKKMSWLTHLKGAMDDTLYATWDEDEKDVFDEIGKIAEGHNINVHKISAEDGKGSGSYDFDRESTEAGIVHGVEVAEEYFRTLGSPA